jgi:hypothetical protein
MPMAKLNLYEFIINTGKTVCLLYARLKDRNEDIET